MYINCSVFCSITCSRSLLSCRVEVGAGCEAVVGVGTKAGAQVGTETGAETSAGIAEVSADIDADAEACIEAAAKTGIVGAEAHTVASNNLVLKPTVRWDGDFFFFFFGYANKAGLAFTSAILQFKYFLLHIQCS